MLRKVINNELDHFHRLTHQAQELITSITLYNIVDPFLVLFTNAFLWRESQSPSLIAMYNLFYYIGLPIAFYLNGLLLKKYKPNHLYFFGNILQGTIISLLIFFSASSFVAIMLFGFMFGIGAGFFWANRNLLTLRITESDNRIYFAGLESLSGTLLSIIVPILIGGFIVLGSFLHLYSIHQGYAILSVISLGVLIFVGAFLRDMKLSIAPITNIFLLKTSPLWTMFRSLTFTYGFLSGVGFLTPIIILKFIGNEDKLGTVQSFAAIVSTVIVYAVAKKASQKHRMMILVSGVLLNFVGSLIFGILYSAIGTLILVTFFALASPFDWVAYSSLSNDTIDREEKIHTQHHFSYVFDQELVLNIGRIVGIGCFFLFINYFPENVVLRFSPLFFVSTQVFLIWVGKSIDSLEK